MHLLFVAIRPPEDIRDRLLDLMEGMPGMRWQDDEQLHLTLRFVGEVERPVAEDLAASLQQIRFDRFSIALDGVGKFEKHRNGVLWAGVQPKGQLKALAAKIERGRFESMSSANCCIVTVPGVNDDPPKPRRSGARVR